MSTERQLQYIEEMLEEAFRLLADFEAAYPDSDERKQQLGRILGNARIALDDLHRPRTEGGRILDLTRKLHLRRMAEDLEDLDEEIPFETF
jgi:hypothetical protein